MLSDHEQRALEELERGYVLEAPEPQRPGPASRRSPRRSDRSPGSRVLVALAGVSVALLVAGVPTAALASALSTAIGWSLWRLWPRLRDGWSTPASADGVARAHHRAAGPVGESIRRYLRWLSEAE